MHFKAGLKKKGEKGDGGSRREWDINGRWGSAHRDSMLMKVLVCSKYSFDVAKWAVKKLPCIRGLRYAI